MSLSLIVAMADNNIIGRDQTLPWRIPEDLKHFKSITMGKPLIMGRRTWDSLGRPLPGRPHVVISRNPQFGGSGIFSARNFEDALKKAQELSNEEIFVIGGAEIYRLALGRADCIYLTEVHQSVAGDTYFPEFDRSSWTEVKRRGPHQDSDSGLKYSFVTLLKR